MGLVGSLLSRFSAPSGGVGNCAHLLNLAGHPARVLLEGRYSDIDPPGRLEVVVGEPDLVRDQGAVAVATAFHFNRQARHEVASLVFPSTAQRIRLLLHNLGKAAELHHHIGFGRCRPHSEPVPFAPGNRAFDLPVLTHGYASSLGPLTGSLRSLRDCGRHSQRHGNGQSNAKAPQAVDVHCPDPPIRQN